ncbi:MAG: RnfABCDGE type electron transport complex subunit B [Paludibacteraceae bacterium]|nr:RnfABCDGE type electron transport complex subunit B [Paludibacteraceae bacterium]
MNPIIIALLVLGVTGLVAAVLLYFIAQKFKVEEDPRIDQVQEVLPGANCGGCGFAGCRALAEACTKASSLDGLFCPVGGAPTMEKVGTILGMAAPAGEPKVAVIRCNGTCEARPRTSEYNGTRSCSIMNAMYVGESGCAYGCLGCGDCVAACQFGALTMNPETGLPEVDENKCTSCGKCVKACPRHIIELRKKGENGQRMVVKCINQDKGPVAKKNCANACIGCGLCAKVCPQEAITVTNNVAYIDFDKCVVCRECEPQCPTGALWGMGFEQRLSKAAAPAAAAETPAATGDEKFDPAIAAKIQALKTPMAIFPNCLPYNK